MNPESQKKLSGFISFQPFFYFALISFNRRSA